MSGGEVRVAIINYGVGNLLSIATSLSRVGAQPVVINSIDEAENFDAVVFPGVGAFKPAMAKLYENRKLVERILEEKPVLGICLGMQLFYEGSEEGCFPGCFVEGLKVFKGYVRRLPNIVKVPHMGWNSIKVVKSSCPLLEDVPSGIYVYYAHSYATPPSEETAALTSYGIDFSAVVWRENIFGTQFHPEKSGKWGLKMLRNFVEFAGGYLKR